MFFAQTASTWPNYHDPDCFEVREIRNIAPCRAISRKHRFAETAKGRWQDRLTGATEEQFILIYV
jgi:hypothetical protein